MKKSKNFPTGNDKEHQGKQTSLGIESLQADKKHVLSEFKKFDINRNRIYYILCTPETQKILLLSKICSIE